MSTKKKRTGMIAAILLTLSLLLAACGSGGNTVNSESGKDTSKPYEIVMAYLSFGDIPDLALVQDEINKISLPKINATVKLMPINLSAWTQQTNLMMAGNEKLDLVYTGNGFNYSGQVAKNQLLPMDDLLGKYGQAIKDAIDPKILDATKVGGKIYGIPSMRDFAASFGIVMRKDLVDKYHIDLTKIKTMDDLDSVFKTIKENEPGVTPLAQLSTAPHQTIAVQLYQGTTDLLGDSFGVLPDLDNNLKLVNLYESPKYKQTLESIRRWFNAGYISKGVATETETAENLIKAGKAFSTVSNMKPGYEAQVTRNTGKEMVSVTLDQPTTTTNIITAVMMSIAKNSQNTEKAMQFLNLLYTNKDIVNLLDNGVEGKHYTKVSDNVIKPIAGKGYATNQWMIGNNFLSYVWEGDDPQLWDKMKTFNDSALKSKALGFSFDAEPVKTELAAVTNALNQYKVAIESGTLDPDKNLIDMNKKLKAAGLDKIMAEKQKQLDTWAQ